MADAPLTKEEFIAKALPYFELAIALRIRERKDNKKLMIHNFGDASDLLVLALEKMIASKFVAVQSHEFGPDIYGAGPAALNISSFFENNPIYAIYQTMSGSDNWLTHVLMDINRRFKEEKFHTNSVDLTDRWEPLPVDRDDEKLRAAVAAIDKATEAVAADNGYAVNHPEEQRYVVDKLRALSKRLKEDRQISWMYVKEFGLDTLMLPIATLGESVTGVVASAARSALADWIKERFAHAIKDVMS